MPSPTYPPSSPAVHTVPDLISLLWNKVDGVWNEDGRNENNGMMA